MAPGLTASWSAVPLKRLWSTPPAIPGIDALAVNCQSRYVGQLAMRCGALAVV